MDGVALDEARKRALFDDGYVHLPGIVPRDRVNAALRAINGSLGERGIDPAQLPTLRARSYCPELQGAAEITGLLTGTPLWATAEEAIGAGQVQPITGGQIALRFPGPGPAAEPHPHIDGMYTPTNGVPEGTIRNFTALIGVLLSDLPTGDAGNFTVWPGSHRLHERYFQERGPRSLLDGMPEVDLGAPKQITGKAGDAVLVHYLLAHGIAGNAAPHIRYAIFFRLSHVDHEARGWESMTDMWLEWAGMRDLAAGVGAA